MESEAIGRQGLEVILLEICGTESDIEKRQFVQKGIGKLRACNTDKDSPRKEAAKLAQLRRISTEPQGELYLNDIWIRKL